MVNHLSCAIQSAHWSRIRLAELLSRSSWCHQGAGYFSAQQLVFYFSTPRWNKSPLSIPRILYSFSHYWSTCVHPLKWTTLHWRSRWTNSGFLPPRYQKIHKPWWSYRIHTQDTILRMRYSWRDCQSWVAWRWIVWRWGGVFLGLVGFFLDRNSGLGFLLVGGVTAGVGFFSKSLSYSSYFDGSTSSICVRVH